MWDLVALPGIEPRSLHWELRVLAMDYQRSPSKPFDFVNYMNVLKLWDYSSFFKVLCSNNIDNVIY